MAEETRAERRRKLRVEGRLRSMEVIKSSSKPFNIVDENGNTRKTTKLTLVKQPNGEGGMDEFIEAKIISKRQGGGSWKEAYPRDTFEVMNPRIDIK